MNDQTETHNHDCEVILRQLSEFIDGELDELTCAWLTEHLAICENCTAVLNTTRRTIRLFGELCESKIPQSVQDRLFQCLVDNGILDEGDSDGK